MSSYWMTQIYGPKESPSNLTMDRYNKLKAMGVTQKWLYTDNLKAILTKENIPIEFLYERLTKAGRPGIRYLATEQLGIPRDPSIGVIRLTGEYRILDVKTVALELELSFGSFGFTVEQYPLADPEWCNCILVKIQDFQLAIGSLKYPKGYYENKARTGKTYGYRLELCYDRHIDRDDYMPILEQKMLAGLLNAPILTTTKKVKRKWTYFLHTKGHELPLPGGSETEVIAAGQALLSVGGSDITYKTPGYQHWPVPYPSRVIKGSPAWVNLQLEGERLLKVIEAEIIKAGDNPDDIAAE